MRFHSTDRAITLFEDFTSRDVSAIPIDSKQISRALLLLETVLERFKVNKAGVDALSDRDVLIREFAWRESSLREMRLFLENYSAR